VLAEIVSSLVVGSIASYLVCTTAFHHGDGTTDHDRPDRRLAVIHPLEDMPTWTKCTARERVRRCVTMLYIHGFLSDSERMKVYRRSEKWLQKFDDRPAPNKRKAVSLKLVP